MNKIKKMIEQVEELSYVVLVKHINNTYTYMVTNKNHSKKIVVFFPNNYPIDYPIITGVDIKWSPGMSLCQILHYVWENLDEDE